MSPSKAIKCPAGDDDEIVTTVTKKSGMQIGYAHTDRIIKGKDPNKRVKRPVFNITQIWRVLDSDILGIVRPVLQERTEVYISSDTAY
jgi:hypothetical protein